MTAFEISSPAGDEQAFYDRITHERPGPVPVPKGQYTLNLTTPKGHVL